MSKKFKMAPGKTAALKRLKFASVPRSVRTNSLVTPKGTKKR